MSNNLLELFDSLLPASDEIVDVKSARPIMIKEAKKISDAISFYEERIRVLKIVQNQGFDTLSEYTEYKEAEEKIKRHNSKISKPVPQDEPTVEKETEKQLQ